MADNPFATPALRSHLEWNQPADQPASPTVVMRYHGVSGTPDLSTLRSERCPDQPGWVRWRVDVVLPLPLVTRPEGMH